MNTLCFGSLRFFLDYLQRHVIYCAGLASLNNWPYCPTSAVLVPIRIQSSEQGYHQFSRKRYYLCAQIISTHPISTMTAYLFNKIPMVLYTHCRKWLQIVCAPLHTTIKYAARFGWMKKKWLPCYQCSAIVIILSQILSLYLIIIDVAIIIVVVVVVVAFVLCHFYFIHARRAQNRLHCEYARHHFTCDYWTKSERANEIFFFARQNWMLWN